MYETMKLAVLVISVLMALPGCKPEAPPSLIYCSINGNGTGFTSYDNSLRVGSLGRAYYIADDLVFHLGTKLVRHDKSSGSTQDLSPTSLTITDRKNLAMDTTERVLYFAADNAIWKVGFEGQNLSRLSPESRGNYSAPVLSACRKYLTAIKDQRITRLDLESGEWLELAAPITAQYAVYYSDADEYLYFSSYRAPYDYLVSLCKLSGAEQDSTLIMSQLYSGESDALLLFRTSQQHRYLAMHSSMPPREIPAWIGFPYWERYSSPLWIYDRQNIATQSIPGCFSFAFVENTSDLIYSRYKLGMADLMRMDLSTAQSVMLWDGYFSPNIYSYSINEVFTRHDGQKIHLVAWRKPQYSD